MVFVMCVVHGVSRVTGVLCVTGVWCVLYDVHGALCILSCSFLSRAGRYDLLVWPAAASRTTQMKPEAHSEYVNTTFKDAGEVCTTKIVHFARPSAAVDASLHG